MNDKELADVVVALGPMSGIVDHIACDGSVPHPSTAVRDWRVAGALMEKMTVDQTEYGGMKMRHTHDLIRSFIGMSTDNRPYDYKVYWPSLNDDPTLLVDIRWQKDADWTAYRFNISLEPVVQERSQDE